MRENLRPDRGGGAEKIFVRKLIRQRVEGGMKELLYFRPPLPIITAAIKHDHQISTMPIFAANDDHA